MTSTARTNLNERQLKFCLAIAAGKSQREAYDAAGYAPCSSDNMKSVKANAIMKSKLVKAKLAELRAHGERQAIMTLAGHLGDLLVLRNRAVAAGQFGSAISAEIARGRAAGLYIERAEVKHTHTALPAKVDDFV